MSHIIHVMDLIDQKENIPFGFEGFDLNSKKLRYFSFIQNETCYENQLFEFKINNVPNTILNRPVCFCFAPRDTFSSSLPSELQLCKDNCIEKQMFFNTSHNLPMNLLEKNKSFLSLQYNNLYEICDPPVQGNFNEGEYNGMLNQIRLYINNKDWNQLNSQEKEQVRNILLHELGHMKASRFFFNIKENQYIENIGIDSRKYYLIPIFLSNGDVFYKIDSKKTTTNARKKILEEMINELECTKISNTYKKAYPDYGKILNELCDQKLFMARYTNGIDTYYEAMTSIIPSEDLANELLDLIDKYHNFNPALAEILKEVYGTSKSSPCDDIQKLIREYKKKKQNKNL